VYNKPASRPTSRSANPDRICYEVVILEPPIAGQMETTVEQTGIWKEKDHYLVERQAAYGAAVARILGCGSFMGRTLADATGVARAEHDIAAGANLYFLPHMTLCDPVTVRRLGINAENFYGAAVSHVHEGTKLLMHDLLHAQAVHPHGWNERFAHAIADLSLPGYAVFSLAELEAAVVDILARYGRARIKLATGADGLGQCVVNQPQDLAQVLRQVDAASLIDHGACVEVDLRDPLTCSVNSENIGALRLSSIGVHRRHTENPSAQTEIGTDYHMVVGEIGDIQLEVTGLDRHHARAAIDLVQAFDGCVSRYLPHIQLTRKTYQVLVGVDARGEPHIGVLEQSWRRGGSSANTLLGAQVLQQDPRLAQVSCSQDNAFAGTLEPEYWVLSTCRRLPFVARVTGRHYV
jgi:hypothetical protein